MSSPHPANKGPHHRVVAGGPNLTAASRIPANPSLTPEHTKVRAKGQGPSVRYEGPPDSISVSGADIKGTGAGLPLTPEYIKVWGGSQAGRAGGLTTASESAILRRGRLNRHPFPLTAGKESAMLGGCRQKRGRGLDFRLGIWYALRGTLIRHPWRLTASRETDRLEGEGLCGGVPHLTGVGT